MTKRTQWDWLRENNPMRMLATDQQDQGWARKRRLLACAACRAVWDRLTEPVWRNGVVTAELFADGLATERARHEACEDVQVTYDINEPSRVRRSLALLAGGAVLGEVPPWDPWKLAGAELSVETQAELVRELFANPFVESKIRWGVPWREGKSDDQETLYEVTRRKESSGPGEGSVVETTWRIARWLTPQVVSLANAAYEERADDGRLDPLRLAVLADALEEEGCLHEDVLLHLRGKVPCHGCAGKKGRNAPGSAHRGFPWGGVTASVLWFPCQRCKGAGVCNLPSPHWRGCWALDLLLGERGAGNAARAV